MKTKTPEQRFFSRVVRSDNGCWEWIGATGQNGYGRFYDLTKMETHRWMMGFLRGSIPNGEWALHRCNNRKCVNPFHVYLGTPSENNQDCLTSGQNFWANKTHCPSGHEYTPENTRTLTNKSGRYRRCMECHRNSSRKYYAATKDEEKTVIEIKVL